MTNRLWPILAMAGLAVATSGCATRRYVRNRTDPISEQVSELNKKSDATNKRIGDLDERTSKDISRVDEKAVSADTRAGDASKLAGDALTKTGQAMDKAEKANSLAESTQARTGQLAQYLDNIDNYRLATTKTVLFGFNKSELSTDAQQQLDELATSLGSMKKYVIEVQGFTDTTGSSSYNYTLSERRAAAVVRYLTEKHAVPVYRVHTIGLGKDMPAQASSQREGRKLSRRVEVKIYSLPDLPQTAQETSPAAQGQAQSQVAAAPGGQR
ncbi:MAG TPA: OmpA family protein [Bryobacterales bacterium]|nr:OmpA family protein [Bryobacterales bacterium]